MDTPSIDFQMPYDIPHHRLEDPSQAPEGMPPIYTYVGLSEGEISDPCLTELKNEGRPDSVKLTLPCGSRITS